MRLTDSPIKATCGIARLFGAVCLLLAGCSPPAVDADEPYFRPGEYGGTSIPGTESLNNIALSPDGSRIALVREKTAGDFFSPRKQLWIMDADGSNPTLVALEVGTVDWSPDGSRLAVTASPGGISIDSYIYVIDLNTREVTPLTGLEHHVIDMGTAHLPWWFEDGRRVLVSVYTTAWLQRFARGVYIIDTETNHTTGPFVELMQTASLTDGERSFVGTKYLEVHTPESGNIARYDFAMDSWRFITNLRIEAGLSGPPALGTAAHDILAQAIRIDNVEQLFTFRIDGAFRRQITEMGGDNPRWTRDGRRFIFRRDVHKGDGARYIPFVYDLDSGTEAALWPALPDSVPSFPPLDTQDPIRIPFPGR